MAQKAADPFKIDGSKILYHEDWLSRWQEAKRSWVAARTLEPIYIEIGPVSFCNHKCTFCGVDYMLDRKDKPMISEARMREVLTDMAAHGVRSVMFAGAGEPLLYKPLADIIVHADAVGIDTALTTNAVLMDEKFCRKAFAAKRFSWIKASVNGGDAENYAKIHDAKPQDFDRVIENLARAVRIAKEMGSPVSIGAQIVALPEVEQKLKKSLTVRQNPANIHTIVPLARRLKEIGVHYFVVKPYSQHMFSTDEVGVYGKTSYRDATAWAREVETLHGDGFNVVVRWKTMEAWDKGQDRGYGICHSTPYAWAYLEADGNVWSCSTYLGRVEGGVELGDHRFRMGNVNEQSFWDIWTGERRRANWEYTSKPHAEGGLDISQCRVNCRMNAVNIDLERLLRGSIDPRAYAEDLSAGRVRNVTFI